MNSSTTRSALIIALAAFCTGAMAQNDPPPPVGAITKQLFPDGSNGNGYADLVLAGEYVKSSQVFQLLAEKLPKATLTEKRKALNDPPITKALELVRRGLALKIDSPHKVMDENTLFPELGSFRQIGRALIVEQYVRLADGRVTEAIQSLRDGLKLGYVIQSGSLIHGLVGIAVDSMVLDRIARHIDQLSVRDCDRLIALANEWMSLPDPALSIFAGEHDALVGIWKKYRSSPGELGKLFDGLTAGGSDDGDFRRTRAEVDGTISAGGPAFENLMNSCIARTDSFFQSMVANLSLPPWERKDVPAPEERTLPGRLCGFLFPSLNVASERFVREQAMVQILGVHAAIRKYRWENDQLPANLDILKVGRLVIDPFSGEQLKYSVTGETTYELSSTGPIARSEEDKAKGSRVPIFLLRKAQ